MNLVKAYDQKVVIAGNTVEVSKYANPVLEGYKEHKRDKTKVKGGEQNENNKKANRDRSAKRALKNLSQTIDSNYIKGQSKFLTLTFEENIDDHEKANREFRNFVKRFNGYLQYSLKYTTVIEYQERGAIHFHVIFYNLKKMVRIEKYNELWGKGAIHVKRINQIKNIGSYMTKNILKNADDPRFQGKKSYFSSQGLKKPIVIKNTGNNPELADVLHAELSDCIDYEKTYYNDYNTVLYRKYDLTKLQNKSYLIYLLGTQRVHDNHQEKLKKEA